MRIAICDDQKIERTKMLEALETVSINFSIEEFEDGSMLLKKHAQRPYDLIFLDILMPKINGMDVAQELRKTDSRTPIVFVSTSAEFGVQSYRVLAFDYLLKPVEPDQLTACMKRLLAQREKEKEYITITYSGMKTNILLSNIQCLESDLRKVIFTLCEGKELEVIGKLSDFEQILQGHGFCRCHQSYIINLEYVEKLEQDTFLLTCGKAIKISRSHLQNAKKTYFDHMFASGT